MQRHHWEPLAWAFEHMKWDSTTQQAQPNHGITFIELAIYVHLLTDGATDMSSDLHTQARLVHMSFKKYFSGQQAKFPNHTDHQQYFQINNKVSTLRVRFHSRTSSSETWSPSARTSLSQAAHHRIVFLLRPALRF